MKKYYKFPAESDLGVGVQYIEFDDDNWPIRQVDCYGDRLFNSNERYHQDLGCGGLCDQPLSESGIKLGEQIDAEEFELKWNLSISTESFKKIFIQYRPIISSNDYRDRWR